MYVVLIVIITETFLDRALPALYPMTDLQHDMTSWKDVVTDRRRR